MKARIVICCNQLDCIHCTWRFIHQDPSYTNESMYMEVCMHPKPDIYDKNEPQNNTMSDIDAIRTNCKSYEMRLGLLKN